MDRERIEQLRKKLSTPEYMSDAINKIADGLVDDYVQLRITKLCPKCGKYKNENEFVRRKGRGLHTYCLKCSALMSAKWRQDHND